jgi:AraC-like DNA-binding protein
VTAGPDAHVVRHTFSTTDTDLAEDFLRRGYVAENRVSVTGVAQDFRLDHRTVAAPRFSVNRMQVAVDLVVDATPEPEDPYTVVQPVGGRFAYSDTAYPDVHVEGGDLVLLPPQGRVRAVCESFDLALTQLDRRALHDYAAAITGLRTDLVFHDITPSMDHVWATTLAHVRDDVLTDPWTAGAPILLDQAFRILAAALLSTFPNSAAAHATDPGTPPARGVVAAATLREVADYLDHQAGEPIGPSDIAEHVDVPYREVVEGMRRDRGHHPAGLLWEARLRGVHRDLLAADPGSGVTVAQLAARWGFSRTGHFRVAYTRAFDATPECTLSR